MNNAEEDARRRTNERANFDGFTRFFPFFLSLLLSVLNNALMRFFFFVLSTLGKDKELVFDFDFD